MYQKIQEIIMEEFQSAERRILKRIYEEVEGVTQPKGVSAGVLPESEGQTESGEAGRKRELPENPKYKAALELYKKGETHSAVARALDVSISTAKNYYNYLVINKWLEVEAEELSKVEQKVVECIYVRKMSVRETAKELGCSVTNVINRRNSAIRKGYQTPEHKES